MVIKSAVFSNHFVLKEDLLPIMTLALSHTRPIILDKGIFFCSKAISNAPKILVAEQSVASKLTSWRTPPLTAMKLAR